SSDLTRISPYGRAAGPQRSRDLACPGRGRSPGRAEGKAEQPLQLRQGRGGLPVVDADEAERLGRLDVRLDVVDEHALRGVEPEQAERVVVDAGLGLAHPHLTGDDDRVEQLVPAVAGVLDP